MIIMLMMMTMMMMMIYIIWLRNNSDLESETGTNSEKIHNQILIQSWNQMFNIMKISSKKVLNKLI